MSSEVGQGDTHLGVRQAAFIGVGAMVGAGIFSLLGAAGEVAGSAVWISFLLAGAVALLQGYSFAKFGARYPSAGGLLEYVRQALATGTSPASSRGYSWPPTRSSPRWWPCRSAATPAARQPTATRSGARCSRSLLCSHVGPQPLRLEGVAAPDRGRLRRDRHPHRLRRRHALQHRSRPAGPLGLPVRSRDIVVERGAHVLRVPRFRRDHVHCQGSAPTRHASCRGRCTSRSGSPRSFMSRCRSASSARSR